MIFVRCSSARSQAQVTHTLRSTVAVGFTMRTTRSSAARDALQKAGSAIDAALEATEPKAKRARTTAPKAPKASAVPQGISRYYEQQQWDKGFSAVAGVDEAGRGPLAGPVVAAACICPPSVTIPGIDDSKKLKPEEREELYEKIISHPNVVWSVKAVDVATIDDINILQATMLAMEQAVAGLKTSPDFVLVDGNRLPKGFDPATSLAITKGDAKVYSIAAASIIAKVTRDRMMLELHAQYPLYGFDQHMGYGVPAHVEALRVNGPCPAHRRTFNPAKSWFFSERKEEEEEEEEESSEEESDDEGAAKKKRKQTKKAAPKGKKK